MTDLHYDMKSHQKQNQEASRRQIMDWLIYHVPLQDTRLHEYPFKIVFHSGHWLTLVICRGGHPYPGIEIFYCGETPWQCYKYVTDKIFADRELRKAFLTLYNNS